MRRKQILTEIKTHCIQEYSKITNWVHDLHHIETVVKNGRKLAKMEELQSKTAFLVEVACWLHDLGRVEEEIGLEFLQSNHAEVSYQRSKGILKPYERVLGRESIFKVLQAVREHNLPQLRHPENRVAQLLQDADRGAGLRIAGVFSMLNYMKLVETEPVYTNAKARALLPEVTRQLVSGEGAQTVARLHKAIQKLTVFRDWYYGSAKQNGTDVVVSPLHTDSARLLYEKGIGEIEDFISTLTKQLITE